MIERVRQSFHHQGFRRYFFNTGWLMADKVLHLVIGLFIGIYVARYLGPERFGILSFAMSFVALFGALGRLGLDGIVVRNAVEEPERREELLGTAFGLRAVGGLALLAVVYGAVRLTDSDPLTRLMVMIIAAGHVLQAFHVVELYFQSQVMARLASMAAMAGLLFSAAIKLALILSGASLVWFAWVFVVENALKGLVLCILYAQQRLRLTRWRFSIAQAKRLLQDSWPLIFSGIMVMIYMRIDQVMIKLMLGNAAVGNYAAAVRLSEAWYFVPMAIAQSLFPAILNARKTSQEVYHNRLQSFYALVTWIGILVAVPVAILSGFIVQILYGATYAGAGPVLAVHIWAGVFVFMGVASTKYLLAENLQRYTFRIRFYGCVGNVVLNFLLIPRFGIVGAALATLLSQGISSYAGYVVYKRTRLNFILLSRSFALPFIWIKRAIQG